MKAPSTNFNEIIPVETALIHADKRTDGHDESNKRLLKIRIKSVSI